jgi:DNA-binding beta-propeller fold protein YncE
LYITTEHINKVTVYRRTAQESEEPLRFIQGPHTGLADPHGIYVDDKSNEVLVSNHGNWRETKTGEETRKSRYYGITPEPLGPSSGRFELPSITMYPRTAQGDVAPVRTIQGSKTQLNLPLGVTRDPVTGQIVVANSGGDSILFFEGTANGNVGPVRILKGPATNVKTPGGVLIDTKRDELWVTNWENHIATVFSRTAQGNVTPLRFIRSAPKDAPHATFGTPGALGWDAKRKQILVPN